MKKFTKEMVLELRENYSKLEEKKVEAEESLLDAVAKYLGFRNDGLITTTEMMTGIDNRYRSFKLIEKAALEAENEAFDAERIYLMEGGAI